MNHSEKKLFQALTSNDERIIGALFTTYNFEPKYFELSFLPALLDIDTNEEAEESLQALDLLHNLEERPMSVLMDARANLKTERKFPNYELFPISDTTQHSKLSFLIFDKYIKLFVASANLTESGIHKNKECYVELKFEYPDDDWAVLDDAINFIGLILQSNRLEDCKAFNLLKAKFSELKPIELRANNIRFVGVGPKDLPQIDFAKAVQDFWSKNSMDGRKKPKIEAIMIVSPFYESTTNSDDNLVIDIENQCKSLSGQKEEPFFDFYIPTNKSKRMVLFPVEAYKEYENVAFWENPNQRDDKEIRFPHLKSYLVTDQDSYSLFMLGSSNFSPFAFGTARKPNWEANIMFFKPEYGKKDYTLFAPRNFKEIENIENIEPDNDSEFLKNEEYPEPVISLASYEKRVLKIKLFKPLEKTQQLILASMSLNDNLGNNDYVELAMEELPDANLIVKSDGEETQIFPITIKDGSINDSLKLIPSDVITKFIEARYRYGEQLKISDFIIQQRRESASSETQAISFDTAALLMYEVREFNHVTNNIYLKIKADCNFPAKVLYHLSSRFGLFECLKTYVEKSKDNSHFVFSIFKIFETLNQVILAFDGCTNRESLAHLEYFLKNSDELLQAIQGPISITPQVSIYKKHLEVLSKKVLSKVVS